MTPRQAGRHTSPVEGDAAGDDRQVAAVEPVRQHHLPQGLFRDELLTGGYRKKYLRAVSRLTALVRAAEGEQGPPLSGAEARPR